MHLLIILSNINTKHLEIDRVNYTLKMNMHHYGK